MNETIEMREMIEEMGEELTPGQRVWRHLQRNRMAMAGGVVLVFFFALAAIGFVNSALMSEPMFDANVVRLPDKLMAPFSAPNESQVPKENLPRLGIYVFGTDDLGRDVFARMLEGTFISMSVGFVAIGIATLLGVAIGGIAGFYGEIKPSGAPLFGFIGAGLTGYAVWNESGIPGAAVRHGGRRSGAISAPRRALPVPGRHGLRRALGSGVRAVRAVRVQRLHLRLGPPRAHALLARGIPGRGLPHHARRIRRGRRGGTRRKARRTASP